MDPGIGRAARVAALFVSGSPLPLSTFYFSFKGPQFLSSLFEGLLLLGKTETNLRLSQRRTAVEAATRNRGNSKFLHQIESEGHIV